jgi:hypothetical protein
MRRWTVVSLACLLGITEAPIAREAVLELPRTGHVLGIGKPTPGEDAGNGDSPHFLRVEQTSDGPATAGRAPSGIEIRKLDDQLVRSLALTAKVWGFLKYHHPDATSGLADWDKELFGVLAKVRSSRSLKQTQALLTAWISQLHAVPSCDACGEADSSAYQTRPNLAWLNDLRLVGPELGAQLRSVLRNRVPAEQTYVRLQPGAGNPVFISENRYPDVSFPDSGYQLLAVFRFWNIVEYWYPYRELLGDKWDEELLRAVRRSGPMQESEPFQRSLIELISSVRDGHASLWSSLDVRPPRGNCRLPMTFRWINNGLVVKSATAIEGADKPLPGDAVEFIDGRSIARLKDSFIRYYVGSNDSARNADFALGIGRGACGSAELDVRRAGIRKTIRVERIAPDALAERDARRNDRAGDAIQRIEPNALYLKMSLAQPEDISRLFDLAAATDDLIVDLRGYPANSLGYAIGARLVERATPYIRFSFVDYSTPGAVKWGSAQNLEPAERPFVGRVVLLVDETTMSNGEFTAMALQASAHVTTVGSQTAGADGNMSAIPIPGGFMAAISGIGVFYPDGRPTQRVGLKIDVTCPQTLESIAAGRDEAFECALKIVNRAGDAHTSSRTPGQNQLTEPAR